MVWRRCTAAHRIRAHNVNAATKRGNKAFCLCECPQTTRRSHHPEPRGWLGGFLWAPSASLCILICVCSVHGRNNHDMRDGRPARTDSSSLVYRLLPASQLQQAAVALKEVHIHTCWRVRHARTPAATSSCRPLQHRTPRLSSPMGSATCKCPARFCYIPLSLCVATACCLYCITSLH